MTARNPNTPMGVPAILSAPEIVFANDDQVVTSTLIIAQETRNEHASVIKLVRTYLADLEEFGLVRFEIQPRPEGQHGGGDVEYALLNEHQSTLLMTYMRNSEIVRAFKKRLVKAFFAFAQSVKNAAAALPDFSDPVAAARAWADEVEAKLRLEAQTRALVQQIETDRPYTDLARAITSQSTMTRRDWCALMKDDHGIGLKERELTDWLMANGYLYRDQLTGEARAYAQHAKLFKLEYHVINGYPRPVLMVTGDGVFQITPSIVAAFRLDGAA